MNELQIFNNPEFGNIRVVEIDGEPWFVGKDIANALGYADVNRAVAQHVDNEDRKVLGRKAYGDLFPSLWDGENDFSNKVVINESGVYTLIMQSNLPNAKKFQHWVTHDVLPTIRKHGAYMTPEVIERTLTDPDYIIQLATTLKEERQKRRVLEAKAEEDKPKVLFADSVAASHTSILIFDLAKILKQNGVDIGGNRLFDWMRKNGYLVRRKGSDYNMPTQRSMEMGLFEVKETSVSHSDGHISVNKTPKVTGKGQQYFINAFLGKR